MARQTQSIEARKRAAWEGLAAAVWVQISAGNAYSFPLYSHSLKSVFGYTQHQLTLLGVANDLGENFGLLAGYVSTKFPGQPRLLLFVGVSASFFGYGTIYLALSHTISYISFFSLWFALIVATNSNAWFVTAVLVTNMGNFPRSRGTVGGILKGYSAIGGAVYTLIYTVFLHQSSINLLLFLTLGIPFICSATMCFIKPCAPADIEDPFVRYYFFVTQVVATLAALSLLAITVVDHVFSLSSGITYPLVALVVLLLLAPFAIPIMMTVFQRNPAEQQEPAERQVPAEQVEGESNISTPLLNHSSSGSQQEKSSTEIEEIPNVVTPLAEGVEAVENERRSSRTENFRLVEIFIRADFCLLWLVYFLGVGSSVTVLNNLAQVGIAVGISNTTVLLSIFSFCNLLGRLISGSISEHFVKSRAMPRTAWMTIAQMLMVLDFLLFSLSSIASLYTATALLGTCYGIQNSLMVPTTTELFGLEHFGVIYNVMMLGNPFGAALFSGRLAGHIYDAEAKKQGSSTCYGPECFRLTFLILAGVSVVAAIIGVILTIRIRPIYRAVQDPSAS